VERTAHSAGFCVIPGVFRCGPPLTRRPVRQQAVERDRGKREALLHQIQQLMHERVMYAAIFDSVPLHGVGPRVQEPAVGLNPLLYFTAPYEEIRLKKP
jgi:hypothetical protein